MPIRCGTVTKLAERRSSVFYTWPNSEYRAAQVLGMVDTVKMRRPDFRRQETGPTGRVEHDSRGNAVWKRTRATDGFEPPDSPGLALIEEPKPSVDSPPKPSPKKKL